ncbi:hypothetical protein [Hoeflea prorocentri]|uniref:Uncharacterized protein n=1 Tax=Hoeflea prorocentri TaxID=1922333 RepID=A0A9X3UIE0_9HYPH|nr:hypothetical protein [Hoeflea prorocentri]MCY6381217.1 hypothetical protein [Hoeflea prorocentri]MDA5399017.1 hypothetical protein [Hoeflea prorocentri]
MLRILVDFLSGIIRVLAVVCIAGGAIAGYLQAPSMDVEPWAGALIGFAAGFLVASVGGGLLACFILIENHLRVLADGTIEKRKNPEPEEQEKSEEQAAMERAERIASYARQYRSQIPQPQSATSAEGTAEAAASEKTAEQKTS